MNATLLSQKLKQVHINAIKQILLIQFAENVNQMISIALKM